MGLGHRNQRPRRERRSELTRTTEGEVAWEAVESYNPIYFLGSRDAES